ncbi:MAG: DUF4124 domain-containing protein [Sinobacteraceae bacterium]|nr:DUF4124 domain-containing protein [Nevskiaceae bacterium]
MVGGIATANAQVYRWTDAKGVVHYSDKPHKRAEKPVELPQLQTVNPADLDAALATAKPPDTASASAPSAAPTISTPADGATIRTPGGHLPVAASAQLKPGQGLVYYLDGKAQNGKPTQALEMVLAGVWRGTHRLSVAVVNAQGKTLSRSAPVTVYMKQPHVHRSHN